MDKYGPFLVSISDFWGDDCNPGMGGISPPQVFPKALHQLRSLLSSGHEEEGHLC